MGSGRCSALTVCVSINYSNLEISKEEVPKYYSSLFKTKIKSYQIQDGTTRQLVARPTFTHVLARLYTMLLNTTIGQVEVRIIKYKLGKLMHVLWKLRIKKATTLRRTRVTSLFCINQS